MSLHSNPITNVVSKSKLPNKVRIKSLLSSKKSIVEDTRSFIEMSMYKIKKYFKNENNS